MAIVAFRRWIVDEHGLLAPLTMREAFRWGPETAVASCPISGQRDVLDIPHGPAPDPGCSCGLYAYASPVPACGCGRPERDRHGAVGVVALWGTVIHHRYPVRAGLFRG